METLNGILLFIMFIIVCFYAGDAVRFEGRTLRIERGYTGEFALGKWARYAVIAVGAIGIILRLVEFSTVPGGVNQDGAMAAVDANALAHHATDRFGTVLPAHLYAWGYGQMSSLLSYLMVPWIWIGGLNTFTMRVPILIASLAGIAAMYFIVRELINRDVALIAACAVSVCPWHFMQSRWALDCNLFPHMFLLGLMFIVLGICKKKYFLYISMIFFALCMYSYGVSFVMVPLFLLIASIILVRAKFAKIKDILISAAVYIAISWPIYITMAINALKADTVKLPFVTMQYFDQSVRMNDLLFYSENIPGQLAKNFETMVKVVLLQKRDSIWNALDLYGSVYKLSAPLILLGAAIVIRRCFGQATVQRAIYRLIITFCATAAGLGLVVNNVNVNRINIIFYANLILIVIAAVELVTWLGKLKIGFIIVYLFLITCFFVTYFTTYKTQIRHYFYADFLEALDFAEEQDYDRYYITPDTQYRGSRDVSEILTLFEMNIDSEYFQGKTFEHNGKQIPYSSRFVYANPLDTSMEPLDNVCYIFKTEDLDPDLWYAWQLKQFGEYTVAYIE